MIADAADSSTRFVLPHDAPLIRNLAALWSADAGLAFALEELDEAAASGCGAGACHVQPSKSGDPTMHCELGGRVVQLHSRYNPVDEARKLVDTLDTTDKLLLFAQGFGLGYHIEALIDQAGTESIVFVFEPRMEVLRAAMEARDFSNLICGGGMAIVSSAEKSSLFARLMPHAALISNGTITLNHAPSIQLAPAEHAEFGQLVADFLAYAKTCVNTVVLNGKRTAENITRNIPWYVSTPSLARLSGAFAGKPAIIVSAGPSLRKNKHLLKEAAGKAVIIAVQTTLQPLLEMGIEPDFVTSLDYHDICTRFFEKLPPGLQTELIAEPKATDAVFDLMPGPVSLNGNDFADALLHEMKLSKAKLPAGATVAHLAFYVAEHLACDPIVFVGQDLGFSDGLCYMPGTSYEDVWRPELGRFCTLEMKQWEQIVRDRPILRRVPDHAGRPTYTEERLFTYLQHFERDFAQSKSRIIDATEGGVLKRGAAVMTLRSALDQFCQLPLHRTGPRHGGVATDQLASAKTCLFNRLEETRSIESISNQTLDLLREIVANLEDQPRVNRAIAKIDALRVQLESLGRTYHLVTQLTQQSELKRFLADRRIASDELSATAKQRRQVERDIDNVSAIATAAREFQATLTDAIDRVRAFGDRSLRRAA